MNRRSFFASSLGSAAAAGAAVTAGTLATASAVLAAERRFQLGSVTYNLLRNMDLETCIQTLEKAGFSAIELRTTHKHGVEPSIGQEERAKVRERFTKTKVKLLSYGSTCEFESPDEAVRRQNIELAKKFVDLAKDTGAIGVKVRPNGLPKGVPLDTTVKNIATSLHEVGEYGESKGIEIWMEVHGSKTQEFPLASRILHEADHKNVGACWNSNPTDVVDGSVKQAFNALGKFIRNCHITELTSTYPYKEFFGLLRDAGYSRYTLAEVAESKEPERFMPYYRKLWEQLSA
jgi:sugar phosphate isomerase/epimerase